MFMGDYKKVQNIFETQRVMNRCRALCMTMKDLRGFMLSLLADFEALCEQKVKTKSKVEL